jgi:hypothetical protein
VSDEEKAQLREQVLALGAAEALPQLALILSLVAARLARFDHPRDWCAPPPPAALARGQTRSR